MAMNHKHRQWTTKADAPKLRAPPNSAPRPDGIELRRAPAYNGASVRSGIEGNIQLCFQQTHPLQQNEYQIALFDSIHTRIQPDTAPLFYTHIHLIVILC